MTNINPSGKNFTQYIDHEKYYSDSLRALAENHRARPDEEFELEVELIPATGYYGQQRSVLVRSGAKTLGLLPEMKVSEWWPFLCAMHSAGETVTIPAQIWTSEDWKDNFYTSVRLDLPQLVDAEIAIAENYIRLTDEHRNAWQNFRNEVDEYWDPRWVKAHKKDQPQPAPDNVPAQNDPLSSPHAGYQPLPYGLAQGASAAFNVAPSSPTIQYNQQFITNNGYPHTFYPPRHINRPVMWILWFFTGMFGGHRYYLGNIGVGVLQTFTAGGLGIWWLADIFLINSRARSIENGSEPRVGF